MYKNFLLLLLVLSGLSVIGQEPTPSVDNSWPPQWLIDLKAKVDAEWKEVHKYVTVVDKPNAGIELPDPVVIGTEEITTPYGGTITVDIIEEPTQPPPSVGHWEEEITEEYVDGSWETFAMKQSDGSIQSFQSWRPQHKLITHYMSWVSDEISGAVIVYDDFSNSNSLEFLTDANQSRRIKFKSFIFEDEDKTRGKSLRFLQDTAGYNLAKVIQSITNANFLFQLDIKHKPQKYSGDGTWIHFAPASYGGGFKPSFPKLNNTEFFTVAINTYWGTSSFKSGISINAFTGESVYEIESPTNVEDGLWHILEIEIHKGVNSLSFTIRVDNIITHDNILVENVSWVDEPFNIFIYSQTGGESQYVSIDNLIISTL